MNQSQPLLFRFTRFLCFVMLLFLPTLAKARAVSPAWCSEQFHDIEKKYYADTNNRASSFARLQKLLRNRACRKASWAETAAKWATFQSPPQYDLAVNLMAQAVRWSRSSAQKRRYLKLLRVSQERFERKAHMAYSKPISKQEKAKCRGQENRPNCRGIDTIAKLDVRVLFAYRKHSLQVEGKELLKSVVRVLRSVLKRPGIRCLVYGHTDSWGEEEYNRRLSRKRARAVYRYLRRQLNMFPASRFRFDGMGEGHPIATNKTESGRARNRRVEFRLVAE